MEVVVHVLEALRGILVKPDLKFQYDIKHLMLVNVATNPQRGSEVPSVAIISNESNNVNGVKEAGYNLNLWLVGYCKSTDMDVYSLRKDESHFCHKK